MTIPGGEDNVFVGSRDYSSSRDRVSGDSPAQGGLSPAASDIKPSVLTCNLSDKDKESGDSNSQLTSSVEMKTNDLKPSLNFLSENDLSDLPFSMPKLERRLQQSSSQSSMMTKSLILSRPDCGNNNNKPNLNLNIATRQARPMPRPVSLHTTTPGHVARNMSTPVNPAISQLKLPLQGKHLL